MCDRNNSAHFCKIYKGIHIFSTAIDAAVVTALSLSGRKVSDMLPNEIFIKAFT